MSPPISPTATAASRSPIGHRALYVIAGPTGATANQLPRRRRHPEHLAQLQLDHRHDVRRHPGLSRTSPARRRSSATISGNPNPAGSTSSHEHLRGRQVVRRDLRLGGPHRRRDARARLRAIIAGIPQDKSNLPTNTADGFTVAQYNGNGRAPVQLRHPYRQREQHGVQYRRPPIPTPSSSSTTSARFPASTPRAASPSRFTPAIARRFPTRSPAHRPRMGRSRPRGSTCPHPRAKRPSPRPGWPGCCMAGGAGWQYRRRLTARASIGVFGKWFGIFFGIPARGGGLSGTAVLFIGPGRRRDTAVFPAPLAKPPPRPNGPTNPHQQSHPHPFLCNPQRLAPGGPFVRPLTNARGSGRIVPALPILGEASACGSGARSANLRLG